jgi:hypothetical protein
MMEFHTFSMQHLSAMASTSPNFTIPPSPIPSLSSSSPFPVDSMGDTGHCPNLVLLQTVGSNTVVESENGPGVKAAHINRQDE